jgi:hypothetical protein
MHLSSDVVMFFDDRGDQSQWPSLTQNTNFKKSHKILKLVEGRKLPPPPFRVFIIHGFCLPLDSAARGGRTSPPPIHPTMQRHHITDDQNSQSCTSFLH